MAIIDRTEIKRAAEILRAGGLVAIPTETVYGLATDASGRFAAMYKPYGSSRRKAGRGSIR